MSRYVEVSYVKPKEVVPIQRDFVTKTLEFRCQVEMRLNELGYLPSRDISGILRTHHISMNYDCFPRSYYSAGFCYYDAAELNRNSLFLNSSGESVLLFIKVADTIFEKNEVFVGCTNESIKKAVFKGINGVQKLKRESNKALEEYKKTSSLCVIADTVNRLQTNVIERMLNMLQGFHPENSNLEEIYEDSMKQVYIFHDKDLSTVKLFWELATVHDISSISIASVRIVRIVIENQTVANRVMEEFKNEFEELEELRAKIQKVEALQKLKG